MLEMNVAGLDAPLETTTPLMHRSYNGGVIQLSPLSSYAVLNGPFVHGGLFGPSDHSLPHRIITDKSCIKCFNDIVGKFVPNRIVQSDSLKSQK